MDKIEQELKDQCHSDLNKEFKIIVTGSITSEEATKMGLDSIEGLENIYGGLLTGKKILSIEKLETVNSIELDRNMEVLHQ
jgi:hypothetical protein